MKFRSTMLTLLASGFLFLAACQTSPAPPTDLSRVSITLRAATPKELPNKGGAYANPYVTPDGMFFKSKTEVLPFLLEIDSAAGLHCRLKAVDIIEGAARYYDRLGFTEWWESSRVNDTEAHALRATINRSYFPTGEFLLNKASFARYLALIAERPVHYPISFRVTLEIGGQEYTAEARIEQ